MALDYRKTAEAIQPIVEQLSKLLNDIDEQGFENDTETEMDWFSIIRESRKELQRVIDECEQLLQEQGTTL